MYEVGLWEGARKNEMELKGVRRNEIEWEKDEIIDVKVWQGVEDKGRKRKRVERNKKE